MVGLAFQMRFRFQLLAAPLAYAVNTQLLPTICSKVRWGGNHLLHTA